MRLVFIGSSIFGLKCLCHVRGMKGMEVVGVVTGTETFRISYRPNGVKNVLYADMAQYAGENNISCYRMGDSMNEPALGREIERWQPDFILVAGWYHMVPERIRNIAPVGGMHASLLPDYSGGAPLVWAIINGEKKTGMTFFLFDSGVDSGPIIGQKEEPIHDDDTISSLYARIEERGIELLDEYLPQIADGTVVYYPQDESKRRIMPQRCPEDGEIDLSWPAKRIYDFVRAQSSPYPGAFIRTADGKKIIIETARME